MHSFINSIQLRFVLLLYVMSVSASGFILDYRGKLCLQGLVMFTGVSYDYMDNSGLQG